MNWNEAHQLGDLEAVETAAGLHYIEGDIILKTGAKSQATWSFDPNFYVRFEVAHKKPHLIARLLQRWLLGIYWRDA